MWNVDYRRFFIDTVLRDYPSPPIYLNVEQRPGSPTVYHVIDGKQRLESLLAFTKDEFHLGPYADKLGLRDSERYYSQLPPKQQQAFIDYTLSVENINDADDNQLREAFDRLNRNVAKLNPQELRNARFDGAFIRKMDELANHPIWSMLGLTTPSRIRRMLDVEFVSELYVLTMNGPQDGKGSLDEVYAANDEDVADEATNDAVFQSTLTWLFQNVTELRETRFRNANDLYGLWAALVDLERAGNRPEATDGLDRLRRFEQELAADPAPWWAAVYADAVRQGTTKLANRRVRRDILKSRLLDGEPPEGLEVEPGAPDDDEH